MADLPPLSGYAVTPGVAPKGGGWVAQPLGNPLLEAVVPRKLSPRLRVQNHVIVSLVAMLDAYGLYWLSWTEFDLSAAAV
jgi:hypothetical protein